MKTDRNISSNKPLYVEAPLFDRLVDENPKVKTESNPFKTYNVPEVVESIARELDNLLNTRYSRIPYSLYASREGLEEQDLSHEYGLPDFSCYDPTEDYGRQRLLRQITHTVEQYEPRLSNVSTQFIGRGKPNSLTVEISAVINILPLPERFNFPVHIKGDG